MATALCSCAGALFVSSLSVCVIAAAHASCGWTATAAVTVGQRTEGGWATVGPAGGGRMATTSDGRSVRASECRADRPLRLRATQPCSGGATLALGDDGKERREQRRADQPAPRRPAVCRLPPLTNSPLSVHPAPAHCTTHARADRAPHTATPQRTATARTAAAAAGAVSPVQPFPVAFPSRWTRVTSPCR